MDDDIEMDLSSDPILQSVSTESLQTAITEVKHVLRVVSSALYSPETSPISESPEVPPLPPSRESRLDSAASVPSFHYSSSLNVGEQLLPDLPPLSPRQRRYRSASASGDSRLHDTALMLASRSSAGNLQEAETGHSPYSPQLVRTTNKRRYDRTLRDLEQLSPSGHKPATARLHYIRAKYCKTYAELRVEQQDAGLIDPPAGLLTVGANILINFLVQTYVISLMY